MTNRRRFILASSLGLCATTLPWASTHAKAFESASILIGFPAGGTADLMGRSLAEKLRGRYASTVIVENRAGAMGTSVANALMSQPPDGSTCLLAPHSMSTLWPHVWSKLSYDPLRDLIPVAMVATSEFALAVGPNVPASSLAEFIQWCKGNPDDALFGTTGHGGTPHFLGVLLAQAAGVKIGPVPYKGAPLGIQDLVAGRVPSWMGPLADIAPQHHAGKVRVIATSAQQRSRFLPQVASFAEAGYPTVVAQERFGVYLRAGTPASSVDTLNKAILNALDQADFRATLERVSYAPNGSTAKEFDTIIRREHERWGKIVKASGFKPNN